MRKIFFLLMIFPLLAGCAPAAAATPTIGIPTPMVGSVTVLLVPGKTTFSLYQQPDPKAPVVGEVQSGDSGKLRGVEASGLWMLVEIKKQTGWMPIQYLDYTIAQ